MSLFAGAEGNNGAEAKQLFLSCGDIDEYARDTKHIYVNVIPRMSAIRVITDGAKYPDWYAVEVKNTGKM